MTVLNLPKFLVELQANGFTGFVNVVNTNNTVEAAYLQFDPSLTQNQRNIASALLAAHNGTLPLGYVDCTTTGPKVIGMVGQSGFAFLPTFWRLAVRTSQGTGTPPTISMGVVGPSYIDLLAATSLVFATFPQGHVHNQVLTDIGAALSPTPIFINVIIAASAGPYVLYGQFVGDTVSLT